MESLILYKPSSSNVSRSPPNTPFLIIPTESSATQIYLHILVSKYLSVAGMMRITRIEKNLPSGETLNLEQAKGLLVVTSQSGGWSACYVVSFGVIYEISVDDRATSQVLVNVSTGVIEITNTYSSTRNISVLLFGY